jgi:very-short-patch-repair endonuclease
VRRKRETSNDPPPPLAGLGREADQGRGEGAEGTSLLARARSMRRASTPAERKLWQGLRKYQVGILKFRRQVPLGRYIADFYCPPARLVFEVDGASHIDAPEGAVRDAWMAKHDIRVVRVSNGDVLRNIEGILIAIGEVAGTPPPPNPLPQGEGESSASPVSSAPPSASSTFLHV